jgi:hypothetical protein
VTATSDGDVGGDVGYGYDDDVDDGDMSAEEQRRRDPSWKGPHSSYLQTAGSQPGPTTPSTPPPPAPQQPRRQQKVRACSVLPREKKCRPCARAFDRGVRAKHACQVRATPLPPRAPLRTACGRGARTGITGRAPDPDS